MPAFITLTIANTDEHHTIVLNVDHITRFHNSRDEKQPGTVIISTDPDPEFYILAKETVSEIEELIKIAQDYVERIKMKNRSKF